MSSFLFSQGKFFEMYVRTCPAMFFLTRRLHWWFSPADFVQLIVSILVISTALQLKFVCGTSFFLLLGQLRELPQSKNNFWTRSMNFF